MKIVITYLGHLNSVNVFFYQIFVVKCILNKLVIGMKSDFIMKIDYQSCEGDLISLIGWHGRSQERTGKNGTWSLEIWIFA